MPGVDADLESRECGGIKLDSVDGFLCRSALDLCSQAWECISLCQ